MLTGKPSKVEYRDSGKLECEDREGVKEDVSVGPKENLDLSIQITRRDIRGGSRTLDSLRLRRFIS